MSGLNIKLANLQISDFHAPECCFLWWHTEKTFSFRPLPGALPLDPTGGLLRPPDPRIIFLLFHFSPVPCLSVSGFYSQRPAYLSVPGFYSHGMRPAYLRVSGFYSHGVRPAYLSVSGFYSHDMRSAYLRVSGFYSHGVRPAYLRVSGFYSPDMRSAYLSVSRFYSQRPAYLSVRIYSHGMRSAYLIVSGFYSHGMRSAYLSVSRFYSHGMRPAYLSVSRFYSHGMRSAYLRVSGFYSHDVTYSRVGFNTLLNPWKRDGCLAYRSWNSKTGLCQVRVKLSQHGSGTSRTWVSLTWTTIDSTCRKIR